MASVQYVKDRGKYRAWTWDARRKKRGPSRMFEHEYEARAWAERTELDIDRAYRERDLDPGRETARVTFASYAATWRADAPPTTQRSYRCIARALARVWPTERIDEITTADVKAAMHDFAGLAPSTRALRLAVMRHIFRAAIADGLRPDDPTVNVKGPKVRRDKGKHRPVTDAEFDAILSHLPEWMRAAALLARDSGLRIGEVAGVRWFRLDFDRLSVMVADVVLGDGSFRDTPKNGIPAEVPLSPRTVDALRAHAEQTPGHKRIDRVFRYTGRNGTRYASPGTIRAYWNAAVEAAGIVEPRPRFHDLRHTRAHTLAAAGAPLHVIQEQLRHESLEITRLYVGKVPLTEMARWSALADGRPALSAVPDEPPAAVAV